MVTIDLTNYPFSSERAIFRSQLINHFLNESPGTGKGEGVSKYKYLVKRVGEHEIYLNRPAQFNNGFDFTLNVSNINFNPNGRTTTRPTHQNILDDLANKKESNETLYNAMLIEIERIYNCQTPQNFIFEFNLGLNSEILLECIKWLFAEQDVTYWNYSGRAMFYSGIINI